MTVRVHVRRRRDIADPEAATITEALHDLGYDQVSAVTMGRVIDIELDGDEPAEVVRDMCEALLVNPVIEDYEIEVLR